MTKYKCSIFVFFCIVTLSGCANGEKSDDIPKDDNTLTQETLTDELAISEVKLPEYQIVGEDDISIATAKRISIDVLLEENPATKEHVEVLSKKIVDDYEGDYDAIAIFYYFSKYQVEGAFTLAKAEWSPQGDWSKAHLKYGQTMTYDFKDILGKDRSDGPTEEDRKINKAMSDLWYEMSEDSSGFVTDEDVAKALAPQYKKTADEMLSIRQTVIFYDNEF